MPIDPFHSIIRVLELIWRLLYTAVYRYDFRRGPIFADGTSFFVDEDASSPQQFSIIAEVQAVRVHNDVATLMLGVPEGCGRMMSLIWRQQISLLERVELEDDGVDAGHSVVSFYSRALPF